MKTHMLRHGFLPCVIATILFSSATNAQTKPAETVDPDYLSFVQDFEKKVMAGDEKGVDDSIDMQKLLDKVVAGVPVSKGFADGFRRGASKSSMGATLAAQAKQGAAYRLLRVRTDKGETHAIYRMVLPNGGLNYHDWVLQQSSDGKIRFVDGYMGTTGENLSETFRRLYMTAASEAEPSHVGRSHGH